MKASYPAAKAQQYEDSRNLEARILLHEIYRTNPRPWSEWVFDHFGWMSSCHVLDLGCGTAKLWCDNIHRIPKGWQIVLSDCSVGMLNKARDSLSHREDIFRYEQFDAQSIPFGDGSFDMLVANHMLYLVRSLPRTLSEIRRVLARDGTLFASTNAREHMRDIDDVIKNFDRRIRFRHVRRRFSLDNGDHHLSKFFESVQVEHYRDCLMVRDESVLADYCYSLMRIKLPRDRYDDFIDYLSQTLENSGGPLSIRTHLGLFIARNIAP